MGKTIFRLAAGALVVFALIVTVLLTVDGDKGTKAADGNMCDKVSPDKVDETWVERAVREVAESVRQAACATSSDDGDDASPDADEAVGYPDLVIDPDGIIPDRAQCKDWSFIDTSRLEVREGDTAYRQWSDAPSIPFSDAWDKDASLDEDMMEACGNPTVGNMNGQGMAKFLDMIPWGDGTTALDHNSWLPEFLALDINTFKDGDRVSAEYQRYTSAVNAVWLVLENKGLQPEGMYVSVMNWHILGPTPLSLPLTGENTIQEDLAVILFAYTLKDGCPRLAGLNVWDKRFEIFEVDCEPTPITPVCTENCEQEPVCTEDCGETPVCTHDCDEPPTSEPPTSEPPTSEPPTSEPPEECPENYQPDTENPGECIHVSIGTSPDPCADNPELNIDVCQEVQDNTTAEENGVNTGSTAGAPAQPNTPPAAPAPAPGQVPPSNNGNNGYDTGTGDGSGTANDGECQVDAAGNCIDGTTTGGEADPDTDEEDPVSDGEDHGGGMPVQP